MSNATSVPLSGKLGKALAHAGPRYYGIYEAGPVLLALSSGEAVLYFRGIFNWRDLGGIPKCTKKILKPLEPSNALAVARCILSEKRAH